MQACESTLLRNYHKTIVLVNLSSVSYTSPKPPPKMTRSNSRWWHASDDADLAYGFDSDDLNTRFAGPSHSARPTLTREELDRLDTRAQGEDPTKSGLIENMSSWLHRQAGSQTSQLATTAVLSGAAVASAILGYQAYRRKEAVHDLKASIPGLDEENPASKVGSFKYGSAQHSFLGVACLGRPAYWAGN